VPAIALTGHAMDEDRMRALAAGFAIHIAKPVDPEELLRAVRRLTA
jgi:ATP-binding cassette subfamily B protein